MRFSLYTFLASHLRIRPFLFPFFLLVFPLDNSLLPAISIPAYPTYPTSVTSMNGFTVSCDSAQMISRLHWVNANLVSSCSDPSLNGITSYIYYYVLSALTHLRRNHSHVDSGERGNDFWVDSVKGEIISALTHIRRKDPSSHSASREFWIVSFTSPPHKSFRIKPEISFS